MIRSRRFKLEVLSSEREPKEIKCVMGRWVKLMMFKELIKKENLAAKQWKFPPAGCRIPEAGQNTAHV